ncbi:MAG: hypothetical protein MUF42_15665 [Cytophagaceae bacterium]|jgi:oxepin-CoA hydrolase/3-oxo-5,6-dehydrosuberyl-CoA semialdehyde dehydrogenase|nr:hypothetical protein [Cytophagaceae bacterium]
MVDIGNRNALHVLLTSLQEHTPPLWGRMTAQHMIEHLYDTLQFSNGKKEIKNYLPEEKSAKIKAVVIHSEQELPKGFKAPMLTETLPELQFQTLELSLHHLMVELHAFHVFFSENPSASPVNPTMGALFHEEWIIFHNKHFTHHFKQFGLL